MNRRALQPDTAADVELRQCIVAQERRSFIMVAGAGSGKTTSLIKGLSALIDKYSTELKRKRQRIACITYTEIAAGEIWKDVGNNPLVHVSTIHSFFWSIVKSFQNDIREWVEQRIDEKLADLRDQAIKFGPRVQERTREKNRRDIARYEAERPRVSSVRSFTYGTGANYPKGILGHDDIIKMVGKFLAERPLFRTLIAQQYPFVFVDESQDTFEEVVAGLKAIQLQMKTAFCLGFFGDPMQRIYPTGIGNIPLEDGWIFIQKPENFRCSDSVLAVANAIRKSGDDLIQVAGRKADANGTLQPIAGTARIFILPADNRRDERLLAVRDWIASRNEDPIWRSESEPFVKVLVIVHRMAATRLGFADLYSALNDKAPDAFKNGFLDASAWPVRPFMSFAVPLAEAVADGREFDIMTILRGGCPLLEKGTLRGKDVAQLLSKLRENSEALAEMMKLSSTKTNRDVLKHLRESQLTVLDPRIIAYLDAVPIPVTDEDEEADAEETSREIASMEAFFNSPASQFAGYQRYVNQESPFSTQQGIKGAEFPRVLVVLDDDEGTHVQFSYDKYFGIKAPSPDDIKNIQAAKETSVERTRRLFYVCCTRALNDLAVVFFSTNLSVAERQIRASGIFLDTSIHTLSDLTA